MRGQRQIPAAWHPCQIHICSRRNKYYGDPISDVPQNQIYVVIKPDPMGPFIYTPHPDFSSDYVICQPATDRWFIAVQITGTTTDGSRFFVLNFADPDSDFVEHLKSEFARLVSMETHPDV